MVNIQKTRCGCFRFTQKNPSRNIGSVLQLLQVKPFKDPSSTLRNTLNLSLEENLHGIVGDFIMDEGLRVAASILISW